MEEIEEQAIKIIFEETVEKDLNEQLFLDMLNYGVNIYSLDKEGNQTRIHPMEAIINIENKHIK